jgi:sugar phosphate isomerase/epimerase
VFEEAIGIIKDLAKYAEDWGSTFIVENYVNNIIGSVEQVETMFQVVHSPGLGLVCVPTNYYDDTTIRDVDGTLTHVFDRLSPFMKIAHAKDIAVAKDTSEKHADIDADESHTFRGSGAVELPAAGLGILNYDLYAKLLSKDHPNIPPSSSIWIWKTSRAQKGLSTIRSSASAYKEGFMPSTDWQSTWAARTSDRRGGRSVPHHQTACDPDRAGTPV